jgi:hypothetical protein
MAPSARELVSWKEIATYLGVGVRTAQLWESTRGLPVRRLPGPRGQVSALVSDLDTWKAGAAPVPPIGLPGAGWRAWRWAGAATIVALLAAAFWWWLRPVRPAHFRVVQDTLIVSDDAGRELWRKPFPPLHENAYRLPGQVWIGDLDGRKGSVVFLESREDAAESLIVYDNRGAEQWRFTPGYQVHTGDRAFNPPFHPEQVLVARLGRAREWRIALTSTHLHYPSQVALLDAHGRLLREYWHSGHLRHLLAMDLTRQGWNTLVVTGISNPRKTSTLLVLDPDHFTGASAEESPAYQLQGIASPVETARVLFPRSCINEKLEPFSTVTRLWREGEGIGLEVQQQLDPPGATLFYHLNADLSVRDVGIGTSFERAHQALHAAGVIDHEFTADEKARLSRLTYLKR